MKAFIWEKYGPPETLRMAEVEKPAPDANEVLVKVLATSVNAADWHSLRGKPLFSRATLGLLRPKHRSSASTSPGRWMADARQTEAIVSSSRTALVGCLSRVPIRGSLRAVPSPASHRAPTSSK